MSDKMLCGTVAFDIETQAKEALCLAKSWNMKHADAIETLFPRLDLHQKTQVLQKALDLFLDGKAVEAEKKPERNLQ